MQVAATRASWPMIQTRVWQAGQRSVVCREELLYLEIYFTLPSRLHITRLLQSDTFECNMVRITSDCVTAVVWERVILDSLETTHSLLANKFDLL